MRRIAHFLLNRDLAHSPPNEALVAAYTSLGFGVDLHAPGEALQLAGYGDHVRAFPVSYGYRWMAQNMLNPRWRMYAAFSGTTEDPMAVAGMLGRLWRRPVITLADEIRSGSYDGPRSARWKSLCRSGMRASSLTIVNEQERIDLQREYAGLTPQQNVIVYPGAFRATPRAANRAEVRAKRGIPDDALVLCYSGTYTLGNGGLWIAELLSQSKDVHVWGQVLHSDPLVHGLLRHLQGSERLHLETGRLGWSEAWSVTAAADIGMVVYLQDAPQFQHMGIASNRLCMFLSMGVPVIAVRQRSFEFVERYDCGILVDDVDQVGDAVRRIASRLPAMRENALECARTYIAARDRWSGLRDSIAGILVP